MKPAWLDHFGCRSKAGYESALALTNITRQSWLRESRKEVHASCRQDLVPYAERTRAQWARDEQRRLN